MKKHLLKISVIAPKTSDRILYRTFWKNPFAFWRWHTYFNGDERYKLPYKW
ncbi:hypothetical protein [Pedobacter sp.]